MIPVVRILLALCLSAAGMVSATGAPSPGAAPRAGGTLPLAGVRIALDPGHQLGNARHLTRIGRSVVSGTHGMRKPCNTTGTATDAGYAEATMTWKVVQKMASRLRSLGARVLLTRTVNSSRAWGPCVDVRGRFGARARAQLLVSVHGDGAASAGHGFFTIAPARANMFRPVVWARSVRLAEDLGRGMRARGFTDSTYVRGGFYTRADLATLNLSAVPVAMIELGNMRNPADARTMTSARGQERYAAALVHGIRRYLHR